jgi:hypothetical protein
MNRVEASTFTCGASFYPPYGKARAPVVAAPPAHPADIATPEGGEAPRMPEGFRSQVDKNGRRH